ncbi:Uncharacterized protein dnm_095070 [Desulfonema magnum]|uniref:Uncharacterized protein n=1 Tax=Desulfonema magnum TaxID=45655 RepID=A0A975BXP0_9BACT|nr:Uncharacterized protein dnm_095070 [Desulfonema magnum]
MHALLSDPGGILNTCHIVFRIAAFRSLNNVGFHFRFPGSLSS